MVFWAMAYRMRPHQDLRILDHKDMGHGPRTGADDNHYEATDSAMLINAMLKRPYPPVSLPAKPYMERRKADLGGAGPAGAETGNAVVRLLTRPMAGGIPGRGRPCGERRILEDRRRTGAENAATTSA